MLINFNIDIQRIQSDIPFLEQSCNCDIVVCEDKCMIGPVRLTLTHTKMFYIILFSRVIVYSKHTYNVLGNIIL